MNTRYVIRQLGLLCLVLGAVMMLVALWDAAGWLRGQDERRFAVAASMISVGICILAGGLMWLRTRGGDTYLGRREALLLVAASWLGGAALAAMPYFLWAHMATEHGSAHPFRSFVDCYFEAMSGLTTTGATVLTAPPHDIESLPQGLLLWRATTHWLGGLGIVVLFVAVLPTLGVGGKRLFFVEAPGPKQAGVRPKIRETARVLWYIYVGLTVAEILLLRMCGMGWFDAVCHTFATLATGGFSTGNASIGDAAHGVSVYITIIFFMLFAGVNFGLYYQLLRGNWKAVHKDPELRLYLGIIVAASVIVTFSLLGGPITTTDGEVIREASFGEAAQHGVFQVVSIQTTTGYCTADFNHWPFIAQATLIALMFIGASAASTGGGIKVIRVLIAFKVMLAEVERIFRPTVVRPIKVGRAVIDADMRLNVVVYILGIIVLALAGGVLIMLMEAGGDKGDVLTAFTASIATLNNIGPGLAQVGAIENYHAFSPGSKALMSLWMVLGRLEVYAILVLLAPRFWRGE